jgi:hypothetical protein
MTRINRVLVIFSMLRAPLTVFVQLTVEIQVIQAQLLERQIELLLYICGLVASVPKLARDEEFFASYDGWDNPFERCSYFFLIPVNERKVDMPVSGSNCSLNLG